MTQPTEDYIKDIQRRMGIRQTGDFDQTKKDLDEVVRKQPKRNHEKVGITKKMYEDFGLESPKQLDKE